MRADARSGVLTLALLSFGHFFIDLYASALGAFQPLLVQKLSLSLKQAGIIGGVLVLFSSVMQPLYGYLSDRFHTRIFSAAAPAIAGLFIAGIGWAPSFPWVLLCVALGGAGIASFHPQGTALAASGMPGSKGQWMALFISAGTLGMAYGPTFFTGVISRFGFERVIWTAIPGLIATAALFVFLPSPSATQHRRPTDWAELRLHAGPLTTHYFLVFIRSILQITYAQFLPLYLFRERGFTFQQASYALSMYLAAGAVGGLVGGNLADRFGGRRVIMASMLLSVPFLSLFFFTAGWVSLIGLALGGLTLLFTIPVNVVMAQQLVPKQAGTISALMMGFSWGMAGLLFIPLTGFISDEAGLHRTLSALLVFPLIGFLLTRRLPHD